MSIDLPSKGMEKRDLRQLKETDHESGLIEQRQTKCLNAEETEHIEDVTTSEIMLVDDLNKV